MGACAICNHLQRADIENAVLNMHSQSGTTLDEIAQTYGVSTNDLKIHMVMHSCLGAVASENDSDSLARKCKLREADMLERVANEYMITLKALGRRINHHLQDSQVMAEKLITKPITDMYIGLGGEIRATVRSLAELDRLLNGPKDNNDGGIGALTAAIQQSAQMISTGRVQRPGADEV